MSVEKISPKDAKVIITRLVSLIFIRWRSLKALRIYGGKKQKAKTSVRICYEAIRCWLIVEELMKDVNIV